MTRVAGANPPLWADILLENRDEIDDALAAFRAELGDVDAVARRRPSVFEASIAAAAAARERARASPTRPSRRS